MTERPLNIKRKWDARLVVLEDEGVSRLYVRCREKGSPGQPGEPGSWYMTFVPEGEPKHEALSLPSPEMDRFLSALRHPDRHCIRDGEVL